MLLKVLTEARQELAPEFYSMFRFLHPKSLPMKNKRSAGQNSALSDVAGWLSGANSLFTVDWQQFTDHTLNSTDRSYLLFAQKMFSDLPVHHCPNFLTKHLKPASLGFQTYSLTSLTSGPDHCLVMKILWFVSSPPRDFDAFWSSKIDWPGTRPKNLYF